MCGIAVAIEPLSPLPSARAGHCIPHLLYYDASLTNFCSAKSRTIFRLVLRQIEFECARFQCGFN